MKESVVKLRSKETIEVVVPREQITLDNFELAPVVGDASSLSVQVSTRAAWPGRIQEATALSSL